MDKPCCIIFCYSKLSSMSLRMLYIQWLNQKPSADVSTDAELNDFSYYDSTNVLYYNTNLLEFDNVIIRYLSSSQVYYLNQWLCILKNDKPISLPESLIKLLQIILHDSTITTSKLSSYDASKILQIGLLINDAFCNQYLVLNYNINQLLLDNLGIYKYNINTIPKKDTILYPIFNQPLSPDLAIYSFNNNVKCQAKPIENLFKCIGRPDILETLK